MEEEVIFKIQLDGEREAVTSIQSLTKANKELREERNKLNLTTEEGRKRVAEINKQLDENTATIKENTSAIEKQRMNVGNYTNSIKDAIPYFRQSEAAVGKFTGSLSNLNKAFLASGIGIFALALSSLIAYFKGSEEGQNNFNKVVKTGTIILGNLLDIVRDFGGAIFKVFTGDFKGAAESLKEGFEGVKNIVSETNEEIQKGLAIENLRASTDLLERELIVLKAKNEAEIASLKLRSEDKSLDLKDRINALNEAKKLQDELSNKELQVAKNRLEIKQQENALSDSTKEDLNEEAELKAQLFLVEKDRADKSKELFTKNQELSAQQNASLREELELRERILATQNLKLEQDNKDIAEILPLKIESLDKLLTLDTKSLDKKIENIKKEDKAKLAQAELHKILEQQKLAATSSALGQSANLFKQNTAAYKVLASAQVAIDTYRAAQMSFATAPNYVLGVIFAALAVAQGLSNIAKINSIQFSNGGFIEGFASGGVLSGTRINAGHGRHIRRSNGDNMVATVRTGEVILNERQQAMLGGSNTFKRIGVPGFATGGFTGSVPSFSASNIARQSEANSINRDLVSSISNMRPIVTVEDINLGQQRVQVVETLSQAV